MISNEHIPAIDIAGEQSITHRLATDLGEVGLSGLCLASPDEFRTAADAVLRSGNIAQLHNLPGSFTAILQRQDECVISTDLAGQFPVRWQERPGRLRIDLAGQASGEAVDTIYLAASLLACPELAKGRTAFQGIYQLEGGQVAHVEDGRLVATDTVLAPDNTLGLADAADRLRESLTQAITRRIATGKTLTSDFSGGRDSTTLALLAATYLPTPMDAFVYYRSGLAVGDLYFAQQIAQDSANIRLHARRQFADTLPFANMLAFTQADIGPDPWTTWSAQTEDSLATLQFYGSEIHLAGDGGDELLTPSSKYIVDLAQRGDFEQLERVALARGRLLKQDPLQIYEKALFDAQRTPADDLQALAYRLRHAEDLRDYTQPSRYTWLSATEQHIRFLTGSMRRRLAELAQEKVAEGFEIPESGLANYTSLTDIRSAGFNQQYLRRRAQRYGIEPHVPYLDGSVIRACLEAPAFARAVPGRFKYILEPAFAGVLPRSLLQRNSVSSYDGEVYRGLRAALPQLVDLVNDNCHLAAYGIIEPGPVLDELDRLDMGDQGMLGGIQKIVAAEIWLRAHHGEL